MPHLCVIGAHVWVIVSGRNHGDVQAYTRECFDSGARFVNGTSTLILSLIHRKRVRRKSARQRARAWKEWWTHKLGTFNDLLEREGLSEAGTLNQQVEHAKQVVRRRRSFSDFMPYNSGHLLFGKGGESIMDSFARRGLLEDIRFYLDVGIANTFGWIRRMIRNAFFLETDDVAEERARARAKRRLRIWKKLHTVTAADAILKAGYPLEEHSVITDDGYVLQMHRIPRRASKDCVFFQHGVLDTSLSWVSSGVSLGVPGHSAAFAAYEEGFDVWLGNTRANPPRENIRTSRKGSKYWRWCANDLALKDLKAEFDYIDTIKKSELQRVSAADLELKYEHYGKPSLCHSKSTPVIDSKVAVIENEGAPTPQYSLQAVGHSLGAACLLMYCVYCKMQGQEHGISRLVLLSPAGFHPKIPFAIRSAKWIMPVVTWMFDKIRPGGGIGLALPSWPLRWITFKLMADVNRSPVLFDLVGAAFKALTSGDSSAWARAMTLPHYDPKSMPAVSLHTANQFAQWARNPVFGMYDYRSAAANIKEYGTQRPPSIAENYHYLRGLPINLGVGTSDGLIPPENVQLHMHWLDVNGVEYTIRQFDYGHLEFILGVGDELVQYIIACLDRGR